MISLNDEVRAMPVTTTITITAPFQHRLGRFPPQGYRDITSRRHESVHLQRRMAPGIG
ncbi:hypothetical protein [Carnimonas nigrificans]|uniref:hypothetical protein n=1 Tax=Carnimonas nigrificans TaxID=64323 RepID=UPI0004B93C5A|nr:hypothetical protein [Carnimonas nigrificans]